MTKKQQAKLKKEAQSWACDSCHKVGMHSIGAAMLLEERRELEDTAIELFNQLGWHNSEIKVCASTNVVLSSAVNVFKKLGIKVR